MSVSKVIRYESRATLIEWAVGSVVLVVSLVALVGVFGHTAHSIALYITLFLAPVCVSLFIR
jgi:hypothetical protein